MLSRRGRQDYACGPGENVNYVARVLWKGGEYEEARERYSGYCNLMRCYGFDQSLARCRGICGVL